MVKINKKVGSNKSSDYLKDWLYKQMLPKEKSKNKIFEKLQHRFGFIAAVVGFVASILSIYIFLT